MGRVLPKVQRITYEYIFKSKVHKTFKYSYLNGATCHRLDRGVSTVITFIYIQRQVQANDKNTEKQVHC